MLRPIVKPSSPHPNSEPLKVPNREGGMLKHPRHPWLAVCQLPFSSSIGILLLWVKGRSEAVRAACHLGCPQTSHGSSCHGFAAHSQEMQLLAITPVCQRQSFFLQLEVDPRSQAL